MKTNRDTKEQLSVELLDELNSIKNDIIDVRALSILIAKYFRSGEEIERDNSLNAFLINTNFREYGILAEEIPKKLYNIQEELEDVLDNKLDTKK